MAKCSIRGCNGPSYATGLCSRHYNRKVRTGSVEDGPRARKPLSQRFWKYVDVRGRTECWPWVGNSTVRGYGYISTGGRNAKKEPSNRATWMLTYGDIPNGKVVRHKCHNRECCNPKHLMLGDRADNVTDMWERPDGAPKGNAKLTKKGVSEIISSPLSSRQIAPLYGVSDAHIRSIRQGRCWKD